jgi:hypothetical protein
VAFKNSGLIFGIFLTISITLLYTYCVHILVSAHKSSCLRHVSEENGIFSNVYNLKSIQRNQKLFGK